MKKLFAGLMVGLLLVPSVSSAATLTSEQRTRIEAIIMLYQQILNILIGQLAEQGISVDSSVITAATPQKVNSEEVKSVAVVEQIAVPTSIVIRDANPNKIYGGDCGGLVNVFVSILDQNGLMMPNQSVSWTNPDTGVITVGTTTPEYRIKVSPKQISGSYPIAITSGDLSTTTSYTLMSPAEAENIQSPTHILERRGNIVRTTNSWYINTDTNMCVEPIGWY